jgi:hypothetical protein
VKLDDEVGLGADRTGQRRPATALGAAILIASKPEPGRFLNEIDDLGNLYEVGDRVQGLQAGFLHSGTWLQSMM